MTTVILRTATRAVVPVVLLVSFDLLLQGHNLPGGGFAAGVLTATAVGLVYVAYGVEELEGTILDRGADVGDQVQRGVVRDYRTLYAVGLAIALASGLAGIVYGVLVGDPMAFLAQSYVVVERVPLVDHLEVPSALAFDVGVYGVVVGSLLAVIAVVGGE